MAEDEGAKPKDAEAGDSSASALTASPEIDETAAEVADASPAPAHEDAVAPTSADTEAEPAVEAKPAEAEPAAEAKPEAAKPAPKAKPPRNRASRLWWALPILMVVEFYVYGHNGRLEICVGKEGDTDFALVGQSRTDENRWKFPRCETRENLGLRSQYEARVAEGVEVACRGATIFRHQGEAKACVAKEQGWQHRVEGHFVPPWDPAYYRHLFWFLQ